MMIKKVGAGAALLAALSVGAVGVAGAATSPVSQASHPNRAAHVARIEAVANAGKLPANFSCSTASTKQANISNMVAKINARIVVGQQKEAAATAAGNTAQAAKIANRISHAQTFVSDLGTVSSLITASCPA